MLIALSQFSLLKMLLRGLGVTLRMGTQLPVPEEMGRCVYPGVAARGVGRGTPLG